MSAAPPRGSSCAASAVLVRFSHTIFGLPFALAAVALAHRHACRTAARASTPAA
ncbi:hypothetical protein [Nannocystis sp. SCPEA4]|uniref:hypothetical protein n=1 Tax=Nannocystis sp. SCPEA4 TaxID=2996787 RepID=UPI00226F20FF|nr:hypothetical protein [Nannocystis sp. SCPEA4]MCY1055470.1 hypothetical protein [Nannocystis sp. SCPEA4]